VAHWKVIEMVGGGIEAVSGPAAEDRPIANEVIIWQGETQDKAEALKNAEPTFPFWIPLTNLRMFVGINIYAGVNAMTTLRRSIPSG
jgi:hypothetical protein